MGSLTVSRGNITINYGTFKMSNGSTTWTTGFDTDNGYKIQYSANTRYVKIGVDGNLNVVDTSGDPRINIITTASAATSYPGVQVWNYLNGYNTGESAFLTAVARGTQSSPTAVQTGDNLGVFQTWGYKGDGWRRGSYFATYAADNWTSSTGTSYLKLFGTDAGTDYVCAKFTGTSTEASIQVGDGTTGNRHAYIDLVGDTTYPDYGLRVWRYNTGANAMSQIQHRGTGVFDINTLEAANITLSTTNVARITVRSDGFVGIGGAPVTGYALYTWGNVVSKIDQNGQTGHTVDNQTNGASAQSSLYATAFGTNMGIGSAATGWTVAGGGSFEILNGGGGYINHTGLKMAIVAASAAGTINLLTGGTLNTNIRARWSAAGNLALGYGSTTDATEKVQIYAGNLKLDGTLGTHGIIFPNGRSQVYAAILGGTTTYTSNASTSLLLAFEGTSGTTVYTDSSPNNFSVTRTGGTGTLSSTNPKWGNTCGYFPNDTYLALPTNAALTLSGQFTVEGWFNFSDTADQYLLYGPSNVQFRRGETNANNLSVYAGASYLVTTTGMTNGTWYHIAFTRDASNAVRIFLNGVLQGTSGTIAGSFDLSGGTISQSGSTFNGYMDDLRITKGVCLYTATFTPPTSSFVTANSTGSIQFNKGNYLEGNANFVFDEVNGRVGLGLAAPTELLHTSGGNWKLAGTAGTHGIIFPDGTKQLTSGGSYYQAFTSANISAGLLTVTHNLNSQFCIVQVYDNNSKMILPDEITATSTTVSTIDLTSFGTITGTWRVRCVP